jgi:hypothetical protein
MILFYVVAAAVIGMGLGAGLTAWDFKRLGHVRTRARFSDRANYKADWKPNIRTDNNGKVMIYIEKSPAPSSSSKNKINMLIGSLAISAPDYQERYQTLIDSAQERAEFLNLEQNTYNYG